MLDTITECELSGEMLKSVDEIVEAVGGNAAAASLAGVGTPAVSNWKARGQIPAEQYFVFLEALKPVGKDLDPAVFGFAGANEARA